MHIVEQLDLVTFYSNYIDTLRERGFRVLVLALIREADAPGFYEDVRRYWSSLDDVTGSYALFAVAGKNATSVFPTAPTAVEGGWTGFSADIASPSGMNPANLARQADSVKHYAKHNSQLFRSRYSCDSLGNIAAANTSQVSALARHLDISEAQLPCLHLTLLLPFETKTVTLPISLLGDFSIYVACKDIIQRLQPSLDSWSAAVASDRSAKAMLSFKEQELDDARRRLSALRNRLAGTAMRNERALNRPISEELGLALETLRNLRSSVPTEALSIVEDVISYCAQGERTAASKSQLYEAINRAQALTRQQSKCLTRALASADVTIGHEGQAAEIARNVDATEREIAKLEADVHELRSALDIDLRTEVATVVCEFERLGASLEARIEPHWNFFVSYAAADRGLAIRLFQSLNKIGKTFLSDFCLLPGQNWQQRISSAQENSDATVALITHNTKDAHFQVSEILRAVNLGRAGGRHRVIPIYPRAIQPPLGLEQVEGIFPDDDPSGDIVEAVSRYLSDKLCAPIPDDSFGVPPATKGH